MGETPNPRSGLITMGETPNPRSGLITMGETPKPPLRADSAHHAERLAHQHLVVAAHAVAAQVEGDVAKAVALAGLDDGRAGSRIGGARKLVGPELDAAEVAVVAHPPLPEAQPLDGRLEPTDLREP